MPNFEQAYDNNDFQFNNSQTQLEESKLQQSSKTNGCCKRISKFIFSHVGLVLMVIIYSVAGAFLFILLESHKDVIMCQEGKGFESTKIVNLKSKLISYIQFNISSNPSDTTKDNETVANQNIESWLQGFRDDVIINKNSNSYIGQDCSNSKWDFAAALLFAVTVITTIGYGFLYPVTWEGQVVCICYATIGIPLFLMCIANISGVLGDMFRFVYARICCRLCLKKKSSKAIHINNEDGNFNADKNIDGIKDLDVQRTGSSIGMLPASNWINKENTNSNEFSKSSIFKENSNMTKVLDDKEDFDNDLKNIDEEDKVTVPLTITMMIITIYIVIGAAIFNSFEGWDMIAAAYFCYITLSTIGFGDLVPGQTPGDQNKYLKLAIGAIYVIFGMAILAMCFDLMQEEIIAKFTWVGKKLGIVEKEEDEIDENEKKEKKNLDEKENDIDKFKDKPSYYEGEPESLDKNGIKLNKKESNSFEYKNEKFNLQNNKVYEKANIST